MPPTDPPLPPELATWAERGRTLTVHGLEVFVVTAGDPEAEPLLILHGFPTCSYDFHRVLEPLARRFRVVVHDHPGFGLSAKPASYSYSLIDQAEIALAVWHRLGIRRGHLLAHDYGTSVATELLARRERELLPIELRSVTLTNGSIYLDMARLRLSQRLLRRPRLGRLFARAVGRGFFGRRIRALLGRPEAVSEAELDALWAALERADGAGRMPAISSYLGDRIRFAPRFQPPLERLDLPAHVLWGRCDPVAVAAIGRRLAETIPGAVATWLDELGHYPMLEAPEAFAAAVLGFLDEVEAAG